MSELQQGEFLEMYRDYTLTAEQLKQLDQLVERTKKIVDLHIVQEPLPMKTTNARYLKPEQTRVDTSTSKENHIKIPVHDDRNYVPKGYMSAYGTKLLDYKYTRYPLGFRRIDIIHGNRIIKEQNSRESFDKINSETYTFFWNEDGYYLEFTDPYISKNLKNNNNKKKGEDSAPTNSDLAGEKLDEADEVFDIFQPVIWKYLLMKSEFFDKVGGDDKPGDFIRRFSAGTVVRRNLSSGLDINEYRKFFKEMDVFFENTRLYLKVMFVMGAVVQEEYDFLNERIDILSSYKRIAIRTLDRKEKKDEEEGVSRGFTFGKNQDDVWMHSNPDRAKDGKRFIINGPSSHKHDDGPVQKTIDQLRKFLMFRPENPRTILAKSDDSAFTGYIYDKTTDRLYPNFTEIERRKNLYDDSVTLKEERELKKYLIEFGRKKFGKKQGK